MSQGDPLDDELYGAGLPLPTPGRPGEPLAAWSDPGPTRDGHDDPGFLHRLNDWQMELSYFATEPGKVCYNCWGK